MGMMPMGHRPAADAKSSKIDSYEQPLPEVESAGRAGVVGEAPDAGSPVVNPERRTRSKPGWPAARGTQAPTMISRGHLTARVPRLCHALTA